VVNTPASQSGGPGSNLGPEEFLGYSQSPHLNHGVFIHTHVYSTNALQETFYD
jgi:hypothetical protein